MGSKERRQREKELRKKQILGAARTLLLKKGLGATSISQIARLSELSVGTIYFYFNSKEEIFAALQEEGLDILHGMITEIAETADEPKDQLRRIALAYLNFTEENKNYFDVINYFLSSPDIFFAPELKERIDEHGNKILSVVRGIIEEGIRKRVFREVNAMKHAIVLWSTLHGLIQFKKLRNTILHKENFEKLYHYTVDSYLKGLLQ
jgi:AcrR family transcriptional regulator